MEDPKITAKVDGKVVARREIIPMKTANMLAIEKSTKKQRTTIRNLAETTFVLVF